jgi:hypothetical protein
LVTSGFESHEAEECAPFTPQAFRHDACLRSDPTREPVLNPNIAAINPAGVVQALFKG